LRRRREGDQRGVALDRPCLIPLCSRRLAALRDAGEAREQLLEELALDEDAVCSCLVCGLVEGRSCVTREAITTRTGAESPNSPIISRRGRG
jgi:hypothetical protein